LTKWYYESGGLLLSDQARDVLFELRRELRGLPPNVDETAQLKEAFPARAAASRLRTKLTEDAFTRQQAFDASPLNAD
jgi:hypothetical protein